MKQNYLAFVEETLESPYHTYREGRWGDTRGRYRLGNLKERKELHEVTSQSEADSKDTYL